MSVFWVIDSGIFAMDSIFNEVCILVTAAFRNSHLVPGFRRPERSLLSRRDQGNGAGWSFLILRPGRKKPLFQHTGLLNERIVAVCARWSDRQALGGRVGRQRVCLLG